MARQPSLTDPKTGEPIDTEALRRPIEVDDLMMVRQVQPRFPSWGMSPERLAYSLRDSVGHDPSLFYELCTDIVEKDLHYQGVLSQRRLASAQLPIAVDPFSDAREHVEHADFVRAIFARPEFTLAVFNMFDALDKGISGTSMDWDTSEGQWMPTAFNFILPAWFRFDRNDLKTLQLVDNAGLAQPLAPFKWVVHRPMLRSGLPVRDGLTRSAAWAWMFKNFDVKAWMVFLEKFGTPTRVIKYPPSATGPEKAVALEALHRLGQDGCALVPEAMNLETIKSEGAGSGDAFLGNANFWDEQMSKLVVGQTGTTDASKGGYAVGRVHDGVRASIVNYDGLMLGITLARDVVRPVIDLNFGPQKGNAYPRIKIGLGDEKNLELILDKIGEMVDRGLEVEASQVYPLLGLTEPDKQRSDVVLLRPRSTSQPGEEPGGTSPPRPGDRAGPNSRGGGGPNREESAAANETDSPDSVERLSDDMARGMEMWADIRRQIEAAIDESTSFEELSARLEGLASGPAGQELVAKLALAMFNARLAGDLGAPIADQG